MTRFGVRALSALLILSLAAACGSEEAGSVPDETPPDATPESEYRRVLGVPNNLSLPAIPSYNPPTEAKVRLGRFLFYEKRLSANGTMACASCHEQRLAFADGLKSPVGSTGAQLHRNSLGLANVAYNASLTWANNGLLTLEDQIQVPIRSDRPIELGINDGNVDEVLGRFRADPRYVEMFQNAFPEQNGDMTINAMTFALATFCRSLISGDTPYDRWVAGDKTALTAQQQRGLSLFNGEDLECFHCHSGTNLSRSYRDSKTPEGSVTLPFFNTGLYNVDGAGSYPAIDQGLFDVTLNTGDRGRFRPASLRNVALTGPYMHDGSIATLPDVIRFYAAGGRKTESGPLAGDGRVSPLKSGLLRGFQLPDQDLADVLAFLDSLTDVAFTTNPAFSDPFAEAGAR